MYIDVNDFSHCQCDSDMIQAALDKAQQTGESVVIPKRNTRTGKNIWDISKTIFLYSESILILQNCHLRMADDSICSMFANKNARTAIAIEEEGQQANITIKGIGKALLDGGKHNGLYEVNGIARTVSKYPDHKCSDNCMMFFQNVSHLKIDGIAIKNQRYWGICMYRVTYSRISNIHFESDSNVPNQDGVDIMKGCHDIIVENITGCVGDNIVALNATEDEIYHKVVKNLRDGDIHSITIRNIMVYGVGGCALIRLLNHDGYRIYNVRIDNVIETSPWSENDETVAPNPDLNIISDEAGNIVQKRFLIPGEVGYRCDSAIIIGESYWYSHSKAQPGDTFGISVSNVMTHARFGIWINNTLQDASFDNIRMFGNGFTAIYFGEGNAKNVRFSNISYDQDCKPLEADKDISIGWNNTESHGFSCVYFNGTNVDNVRFERMRCAAGMDSVFGGHGTGNVVCENIQHNQIDLLSNAQGINIRTK